MMQTDNSFTCELFYLTSCGTYLRDLFQRESTLSDRLISDYKYPRDVVVVDMHVRHLPKIYVYEPRELLYVTETP